MERRARSQSGDRPGGRGVADAEAGRIGHDHVVQKLQKIAISRGHYHGYPMPLEGHSLQLCRGFPYPDIANVCSEDESDPVASVDDAGGESDEDFKGGRVVNIWPSRRLGCRVAIVETKSGRRVLGFGPRFERQRLDFEVATLHASLAWDLKAEHAARERLRALVTPHQYRCYDIGGAFAETSERSGVTYIFRRLRPTVAIRQHQNAVGFLAALCLHPLGYYTETFAGAMVPSDDVIAHLMMMRADEPMFWRRSNQHRMDAPEVG